MSATTAALSRKTLVAGAGALIACIGRPAWRARMSELKSGCSASHAGRALAQRHAVELCIDRIDHAHDTAAVTEAEARLLALADEVGVISRKLTEAGRCRLGEMLAQAMRGDGTLIPIFHLMRTARLQRERGFSVGFAGLDDSAPFDLLLWRDGVEAEIVCDVISAEAGRDFHRGAWVQLLDRVDADLQSWLADHPGRYLLKMTLPNGLRRDEDAASGAALASLHTRIAQLLSGMRRADHDEAAILRLDPLMLAAAQASELGLMPKLRQEFGPEAHLAVTASGKGVFVMAARAAKENEVAQAVHRRMSAVAPARLTGTRPGILAMFVEDTDRLEWRILRDQLRLEGEARHFMTRPEARSVIAVSCISRQELLGDTAQANAELRFRNPTHKDSRVAALAPAILSSP